MYDRKSQADIDPMFLDRWSPRAFRSCPVRQEDIERLFEAARWAPSCFNEQPSLFLYATIDSENHKVFASLLNETNQKWAPKAPVLIFTICKRNFSHNGNANRHAKFDAGAAWMSLALQARKLDLYTHSMAGFDVERAYEVLSVPKDEYEIIAAMAVGYRADASELDEEFAAKEKPNVRKPLSEIALEGTFSQSRD